MYLAHSANHSPDRTSFEDTFGLPYISTRRAQGIATGMYGSPTGKARH